MYFKLILIHAAVWAALAAPVSAGDNRPASDSVAKAETAARTDAARADAAAKADVPTNGPFGEADYRLGPEDQIQFFVWKEPDLSTTVVVRPDGKISLPLVGEIEAVGKTAHQLQEETAKRLRQFVTDPVVTVIVTQINSPKISVLGQVRRPDVYRMKQRMTVLDAIALAGGFSEYADGDKVVIIRNGKWGVQRIKLNLKPLIKDGRSSLAYVQPADTVYVE